jgi:hypothetical protein
MGFDFDEFDELAAAALEGEVAADPMAAAVDELFSGRGPSSPMETEQLRSYGALVEEGDYAQEHATQRRLETADYPLSDFRGVIRAEIDAVLAEEIGEGLVGDVDFDPRVMEYLATPDVVQEVISEVANRVAAAASIDYNALVAVDEELEVAVVQELDSFLARGGYADRFHPVREYLESRGAPLGRDAVTGEPIQVVGLDPAGDPAVAADVTGEPITYREYSAEFRDWLIRQRDDPAVAAEGLPRAMDPAAPDLQVSEGEPIRSDARIREIEANEGVSALSDSNLDWALRDARSNVMGAMSGNTYDEWRATPAMERLAALEAEVTRRETPPPMGDEGDLSPMQGLSPADRILMERHEGFPARSPEIPGLTGIPAARPQLPEVTGFPATVEPGPRSVGFPIPEMQGPQIVQSAGTNGTSPRPPPVSSVDFIDWLNRQRGTVGRPPLTPQEEQSVRDSMGGGAAQARGLTADQAFQMHRATSGIGQEELPLGDKTGKRWTPEESARGLAGVEGARDVLEGRVTPPPHPDEVRAPVGPQPEQGELDLNPEARSMDSAMLQDLFAQRAAGPEQGYAGWAGDLPGGGRDVIGDVVDSLQDMSGADRTMLIAGLIIAGVLVVGSGGTLTPVGGAVAGAAASAAGLMALNQ